MANILVLDDDPQVREMISVTLEPQGHSVTEVSSPSQAREQIEKRPPDLILLDLLLGEEDGLELLKELASESKTAEIPIIVVSALRQKKKIIEGLKDGAIDYICKPFDPVELRVRVTSALKVNELRAIQARNQQLAAMRETARTVQNEIDLPLREIQRGLIQLRNEAEDFDPKDRELLEQAWSYFTRVEDILAEAMRSGKPA